MLNKLPPGVCWRGGGGAAGLLNEGGGSNRLVAKQAVEFPQVYTSFYCSSTLEYILYCVRFSFWL